MSSIKLQHYDVISCKQRNLIKNIIGAKGYHVLITTENLKKVSFINEGVIAFSK